MLKFETQKHKEESGLDGTRLVGRGGMHIAEHSNISGIQDKESCSRHQQQSGPRCRPVADLYIVCVAMVLVSWHVPMCALSLGMLADPGPQPVLQWDEQRELDISKNIIPATHETACV